MGSASEGEVRAAHHRRGAHIVAVNQGLDCRILARTVVWAEKGTACVRPKPFVLGCSWGSPDRLRYFHLLLHLEGDSNETGQKTETKERRAIEDLCERSLRVITNCQNAAYPKYAHIFSLRSDRLVGLFSQGVTESNKVQVTDGRKVTVIMRSLLEATIPKNVSFNGYNGWNQEVFLKRVRRRYDRCPYNVVTMFIECLNTTYVYLMPEDLTYSVARLFIRNLFNSARPVIQTCVVADTFMERLLQDGILTDIVTAIASMFAKELFEGAVPCKLTYSICELYLDRLLRATARRTLCLYQLNDIDTLFAKHMFLSNSAQPSDYVTHPICDMYLQHIFKCASLDLLNIYDIRNITGILFQGLFNSACGEETLLRTARMFVKCVLSSMKKITDMDYYSTASVIEKLCQSMFKASIGKSCASRIIMFIARQLFDVPKDLATRLPGMRSLFEDCTSQELKIDIASLYVNMFFANANQDVVRDSAWQFWYMFYKKKQAKEVVIELTDMFIRRLFTSNLSRELVASMFGSLIYRIFDKQNLSKDVVFELAVLLINRLYKANLSHDLTRDLGDSFSYFLCSDVMNWNSTFDVEDMFNLLVHFPKDLILRIGERYIEMLFEEARLMPEDLTLDVASTVIEKLYDAELPCEVTLKIGSVIMKEVEEAPAMSDELTLEIKVLFENCLAFWCHANQDWYLSPHKGG